MRILELIALVFQEASIPASKAKDWPLTNGGALRSRPLANLWKLSKPRWRRTAHRRWCKRYNPSGLVGARLAFSKVSFHGCVPPCLDVSLPTPLISIQAWIEASTKGGVLLFTASEIETATTTMGMNPATGGLLGGMGGGIAQAYATMGKSGQTGQVPFPSSCLTCF